MLSIALTALSLAQPQLSSTSNNIVASRQQRQDVDVFALAESVSTLTSEVSLMNRAMNDNTVNDVIGRLATQTIEATTAIREENAVLRNTVSTLTAQMAAVPSQIAAMSVAQATATATLTSSVSTTLSTSEATLTASVSRSVASMTATAAAQQSTVAASMTAMNSTVARSLASKMNTKKHIFVGGCSSHSYGGWRDICMNRVETDTARPKFYKETASRMKALVRGLFRISGQSINESCNWARIALMVNGQTKYESLLHTAGWWWKDIHSNHVMEITNGQQFWIRQHAACGRLGYHAMSGSGGHQRNEFEYVGAARDQDI